MMHLREAALLCIISAAEHGALALRTKLLDVPAKLRNFSFAQFTREYRRDYTDGTEEYRRRAQLFEASLAEIHAVNMKNAREDRSWVAGPHPFMDWTQAERAALHGYKPSRARGARPAGAVALLHQEARGRSTQGARLNASSIGGLSADVGPAVRQQGGCGSCWAISAVEAVEAQLQRAGSDNVRLSAQALVDCVPNPQHCGGTGGCDGATGELAYAFMRDHGIPLEPELPYTAHTAACPNPGLPGAWPSTRRARVSGWSPLPSNQVDPLMQALVERGPVVVAVDGNDWFNYDSGIFDSCAKDATLGHAVLAKGYGDDSGKRYWLIQNSWGSEWGENGHIRLKMQDNEESWCGVDRKPQEGVGCDGGPSEVTVCGACGILYDPIFPEGVRLEGGDSVEGADAQAEGDLSATPRDMQDAASSTLSATHRDAQDASSPAGAATATQPGHAAEAEMEAVLRKLNPEFGSRV